MTITGASVLEFHRKLDGLLESQHALEERRAPLLVLRADTASVVKRGRGNRKSAACCASCRTVGRARRRRCRRRRWAWPMLRRDRIARLGLFAAAAPSHRAL
jgi:hypothetical protein